MYVESSAEMLKCFEAGTEKGILPPSTEKKIFTDFIRDP